MLLTASISTQRLPILHTTLINLLQPIRMRHLPRTARKPRRLLRIRTLPITAITAIIRTPT